MNELRDLPPGFTLAGPLPQALPATGLPPFTYTDASGKPWAFHHIGRVEGHMNGTPFTTERWRVRVKPGYDRNTVGPVVTAAFAGRHGERELQGLRVEQTASGWLLLSFVYGPAASPVAVFK